MLESDGDIIARKTVVSEINSMSGARNFYTKRSQVKIHSFLTVAKQRFPGISPQRCLAGKSAAKSHRDRSVQSDHYFSFPLLWYFKIITHFFVLKNDSAMLLRLNNHT